MKAIQVSTLSVFLAVVSSTAFAQLKPEDAIAFRQSGYKYMAWNMNKIKANLDGQFNKEQVIGAANVIAAIANSNMGALYVPGSEFGKGWKETRVKPELFTDRDGVGRVARAFNEAANEMARVAGSGDVGAIRSQFGKLGESCKACHERFRKEDH